MRDFSNSKLVRELREYGEYFRFELEGTYQGNPHTFKRWNVFRKLGDDHFEFVGTIEAHPKTSNRKLFEEAFQRFAD